jgi:hypothetical protein
VEEEGEIVSVAVGAWHGRRRGGWSSGIGRRALVLAGALAAAGTRFANRCLYLIYKFIYFLFLFLHFIMYDALMQKLSIYSSI